MSYLNELMAKEIIRERTTPRRPHQGRSQPRRHARTARALRSLADRMDPV